MCYKQINNILGKYIINEKNIITKITACILGTLMVISNYEDAEYVKSVMERLKKSKGELIKRFIKSQQITGFNYFIDDEVINLIGRMSNEDYKELLNVFNNEEIYGFNLLDKIIDIKYEERKGTLDIKRATFFYKIFNWKDEETYHDPFMNGNFLSIYPAYLEDEDLYFVGCESSRESLNLYNLINYFMISGAEEYVNLSLRDSIINPLLDENGDLKKFSNIISFPPVEQAYSLEIFKEDKFNRFRYTEKSNYESTQWIYVDHILSVLNDDGKALVILPIELLYKGEGNKEIRKALVLDDIIEKIIEFPEDVLSHKKMCAIFFNKNKEKKGIINFIDLTLLESLNYEYEYYGLRLLLNDICEEKLKRFCKNYDIETIEQEGYNLKGFNYISKEIPLVNLNENFLQTNRLILREFKEEDFLYVHAYASDLENVKYMNWGPNTEEDTKNFIKECIKEKYKTPRLKYDFAIVLKETNKVIGGCGIYLNEDEYTDEGMLGWILNKKYWKQGYMTEAVHELIRFAFVTLDLHRIYAYCYRHNYASYRVMEKNNMIKEAQFRKRRRIRNDNKIIWDDELHYAILEEEWEK